MVTAARQQLSASAATHSADPRTVSVMWANIIWTPSVMLQLSEHFSYPNTPRSQHVRISDLRLYIKRMHVPSATHIKINALDIYFEDTCSRISDAMHFKQKFCAIRSLRSRATSI